MPQGEGARGHIAGSKYRSRGWHAQAEAGMLLDAPPEGDPGRKSALLAPPVGVADAEGIGEHSAAVGALPLVDCDQEEKPCQEADIGY